MALKHHWWIGVNELQEHKSILLNTHHKLEQLECLHSEDTPHCTMITHTIYWPVHIGSQFNARQSQSYTFKDFAKT